MEIGFQNCKTINKVNLTCPVTFSAVFLRTNNFGDCYGETTSKKECTHRGLNNIKQKFSALNFPFSLHLSQCEKPYHLSGLVTRKGMWPETFNSARILPPKWNKNRKSRKHSAGQAPSVIKNDIFLSLSTDTAWPVVYFPIFSVLISDFQYRFFFNVSVKLRLIGSWMLWAISKWTRNSWVGGYDVINCSSRLDWILWKKYWIQDNINKIKWGRKLITF